MAPGKMKRPWMEIPIRHPRHYARYHATLQKSSPQGNRGNKRGNCSTELRLARAQPLALDQFAVIGAVRHLGAFSVAVGARHINDDTRFLVDDRIGFVGEGAKRKCRVKMKKRND